MFRLFKKKRKLDPMSDQLNLAIEDLEEKWISFTKTTRFKSSDPISENIDIFAQPQDIRHECNDCRHICIRLVN